MVPGTKTPVTPKTMAPGTKTPVTPKTMAPGKTPTTPPKPAPPITAPPITKAEKEKEVEDDFKKKEDLAKKADAGKTCASSAKVYCEYSSKEDKCEKDQKACLDLAPVKIDADKCVSDGMAVCPLLTGPACVAKKDCDPREIVPEPACTDGKVKCDDNTCHSKYDDKSSSGDCPTIKSSLKTECSVDTDTPRRRLLAASQTECDGKITKWYTDCMKPKKIADICGTDKKPTVPCNGSLPYSCPGGLNCAASLKACAEFGSWDGCPPSKTACPGARLACVEDPATECKNKTGCSIGLEPCGVERDAETGEPKKEGNARKIKCMAKCTKKTPGPFDTDTKPKSIILSGKDAVDIKQEYKKELLSETDKPVMRMNIKKDALKPLDSSLTNISFVVNPVPDSDITDGPFASFKDVLLSSVISISPSAAVNFAEGEGVDMEFPMLDDLAQTNDSICDKLLARSTVVSYSETQKAENVTVAKKESKTCSKGAAFTNYTCVCKLTISHFSEYAVAETSVAETSAPIPVTTSAPGPAPTPTSDDDKGLGAGAIAGIIIGVLVVVCIIGYFVVQSRKKHASTTAGSGVDL